MQAKYLHLKYASNHILLVAMIVLHHSLTFVCMKTNQARAQNDVVRSQYEMVFLNLPRLFFCD